MPKVLMIAYYFPPIASVGAQRTVRFATNLLDYGWEPHVLTPRKRYHYTHLPENSLDFGNSLTLHESKAFLPVQLFQRLLNHKPNSGLFSPQKRNVFSGLRNLIFSLCCKPDEFRGWIPYAVRKGKQIIEKEQIDLIYSSGPPNSCHIIGHALKNATHKPWVADLRDLWNMFPHSYNPFHWQWRINYDRQIEYDTLKNADRIITTSAEMRQKMLHFLDEYPKSSIHTVTNGYDAVNFSSIVETQEDSLLILSHVGSLFSWRSLEPLLRALRIILEKSPVWRSKFLIKLAGIIPEREIQLIKTYNLQNNIRILGNCSHERAIQLMRESSALFVLTGALQDGGLMIPAKLFEYIAAEKPIISIGPAGACSNLILSDNLGWHFKPDQVDDIAARIIQLIRERQNGGIEFSNPRKGEFEQANLTKKLARIFSQCLESQSMVHSIFDPAKYEI